MSTATALGRYLQLATNQRKDHTVAELRCAERRCLLASVLAFEWQGHTHRAVLVQVHTNALLTKQGKPDGVNATAPREAYPGLTVDVLDDMAPAEVLDLLHSGQLKEAHLEALFRNSGGNLARLAYVAVAEDFKAEHSPNRFARCDHISGYLKPEAFNITAKTTLLTRQDLAR